MPRLLEQSPNSNSRKRLALKPKMDPERSLWPSFKKINALKRQLKAEKTASSKKRTKKAESILSTNIDLTTSSDEGENKEYLFTFSKPFSISKIS
jgi:hypothetical protein